MTQYQYYCHQIQDKRGPEASLHMDKNGQSQQKQADP
jgi:hypothetical protein